jgi:tyrosyl-tRNA synthetase
MNQQIYSIVQRGCVDIFGAENLQAKLRLDRPLRIKAGFDPTAPDLHLGHTVLLTKMRQLQDLGHEVIFLIGDFTGLIGDPSGKNATRPILSTEAVQQNARTYQAQFNKILDPTKTRVYFNSQWLNHLTIPQLIQLMSTQTVARMLEREDFHKRYQNQQAIGLHEFLYPLLQAYDSVKLEADIELGGTDQTFNLLLGRELQKHFGQPPQVVMTLPLLEGLDGVQKMSKSLNNYISLQDPPDQMFAKILSISDILMWRYFELLSLEKSSEAIAQMQEAVRLQQVNPRDFKISLALEITSRYHGATAAASAKIAFEQRFRYHQIPQAIPEKTLILSISSSVPLPQVLKQAQLVNSTSEAIRLINSGAVKIDQVKIQDKQYAIPIPSSHIYQIGKRCFAKITLIPR